MGPVSRETGPMVHFVELMTADPCDVDTAAQSWNSHSSSRPWVMAHAICGSRNRDAEGDLTRHRRYRPENSRHSHDRTAGTGADVSKIFMQEVLFTPADAAEALETIAGLERDGRGTVPARWMYGDPHEPPYWWHVSPMLKLTLLARTVAAQEGTAPAPGNPFPLFFPDDPITNGAALLRLKAKLS